MSIHGMMRHCAQVGGCMMKINKRFFIAVSLLVQCYAHRAFADEVTVIEPAKESMLQDFKRIAGPSNSKYFAKSNKGDDSYDELYVADINNDGTQDYVLTHCFDGKEHIDTIVEVFDIKGRTAKPLKVDDALPDGLGLPSWFHNPFIIVENGITFAQFTDHKNDFRYVWKSGKFELAAKKKVKSKEWKIPKNEK